MLYKGGKELGGLEKLYYLMVCIGNDFKHIHTHASGHKWDSIHTICNEYYEKATEHADTLVELALECGETVQNASLAMGLIDYRAANMNRYGWDEMLYSITPIIEMFINEAESLYDIYAPDIVNLLQEYVRYWKKENEYKNRGRLGD